MRPATAPESSIEMTIIRLGSMPLARAAVSDCPLARRSKPNLVLVSSTQKPTPSSTARIESAQTWPSRGSNGVKPVSSLLSASLVVCTVLPSCTP